MLSQLVWDWFFHYGPVKGVAYLAHLDHMGERGGGLLAAACSKELLVLLLTVLLY